MNTDFDNLCRLCRTDTTIEMLAGADIDWTAVWQSALRHRVVPVLADRIKQLGITVPEEIAGQIKAHVQQNLLRGMKQSAELALLTQAFQKQDIPFLVLKGLAFNHVAGVELAQRHVGDIDLLLARPDDLFRADQLLQTLGYRRESLSPAFPLNDVRRAKYLFRHTKDIEYWHPQKQIALELHFKLFTNDYTYPVSVQDIYANRDSMRIGKTFIPVMSRADHQTYLLVHGASCGWFRLKWLCDIPLISNNGQDYLSETFWTRASALGIERVVLHGLWLAHEQLGMPIKEEVGQQIQANSTVKTLVFLARQHQLDLEPDKTVFPNILRRFAFMMTRMFRYSWLLRGDAPYKLRQIIIPITKPIDWETMPLPPTLFWLYYFLGPFIWLKRRL